MSEALTRLEAHRNDLLATMAGLDDMRPGSIVGAVRRCGKPTCHCAQSDDPGHGPNLRITHKRHGKTITEALPSSAAVRKAEREIAEFRRFQRLSQELVEVSEQICRLRPVEDMLTSQEKTAEAIQQEAAREIAALLQVIFSGSRKSGTLDLEAIEMATRAATHQMGAKMLEQLLTAPTACERSVVCACGQQAHFHELRAKQILTVLGPITIQRPYYVCPHCHQGQSPRDLQLDVKGPNTPRRAPHDGRSRQ